MLITSAPQQQNIIPFLTLLNPNVKLHAVMEMVVQKAKFGEITFTMTIKNGVAELKTLGTVVRKRRKY